MSVLSTSRTDKRPFKGKGAVEWLAREEREYRKLLGEMERLSNESRKAPGNAWYLFLHHRKVSGQHFLMWRSFGHVHAHLPWEKIEPQLSALRESQRNWFIEANELSRLLNARERAVRHAVKLAADLVSEAQ